MSANAQCVIVGGGPAGSLLALQLARAGVEMLIVDAGNTREGPFELLSPRAIRALAACGLNVGSQALAATRCAGVESRWAGEHPEYFDYELYECQAGAFIDRRRFHAWMLQAASNAGVSIARARVAAVERQGGLWQAVLSDGGRISSRSPIIWASGGMVHGRTASERRYSDRLMAFYVPAVWMAGPPCLVLETADCGWWYLTHGPGGRAHLVFMTDADCLSPQRAVRAAQLERSFRSTHLTDYVEVPDFVRHRGCDARSSVCALGGDAVCVGDAAWSTDPLSGSGITLALESARHAGECLLAGHPREHARWAASQQRIAWSNGRAVYASARQRMSSNPFWQRRRHKPDQGV